MEWIIIVVLFLTAVNFIALYWKGIKERLNLRNLLLQILLDEETYKTQKEGLDSLVKNMNVDSAENLAMRVNKSVDNFANKAGKDTMVASYGLLWGKNMVTPSDTIDRLNILSLNDEDFRQIHHGNGTEGKNETAQSHIKYLSEHKSFNKNKDNYTVALRLRCVEATEKQGFDRQSAISRCMAEHQFNKTT